MKGVLDPDSRRRFGDGELSWFNGHLSELRGNVSERPLRRLALWSGLAIGLAVHLPGCLRKS